MGISSQPSRDLASFSLGQSPRAFKGHSILWNAGVDLRGAAGPPALAATALSCDSVRTSKVKASKAATEKHCLDNNPATAWTPAISGRTADAVSRQ
jgi:hypothetical protein